MNFSKLAPSLACAGALAATGLVSSSGAQNSPSGSRITRDGTSFPAPVVAQQAVAGTTEEPRELEGESLGLFQNSQFVRPAEHGFEAFGDTYMVDFASDGFVFTPALGRRAPHNFTFEFELESIAREGHVSSAQPVAPTAQGLVVSYERAGGVVESYELGSTDMEQTFTFPHEPAGWGDLVVRGRISGSLAADRIGEAPEGLRFLAGPDGEYGGVRFSGVTGIDANGQAQAGNVRFDGARIELVLPASFVEAASYPMVLDPFIGSEFGVHGSSSEIYKNPDTAYDSSTDRYCTVAQWEPSASDVRIRFRIHSPSSGSPFLNSVLSAFGFNMNPTVANVNSSDTFLCVWQSGPSATGPWDLAGLAADANGTTSGFVSNYTSGSTPSEITPDLASESTVDDNDMTLVWSQDGEIWGTTIALPSEAGNGTFGTAFRIDGGFGTDSNPAIAKAGGTSGNHLVVWQRLFDDGAGNDSDCLARVLDRDGTFLTPETNFTFPVRDEEDPDCDGDGESWTIAFEASAVIDGADNDIFARKATLDGGLLSLGDEILLEADLNQNEVDPAVAFLGSKTAIAWSEEVSPGNFDVLLRAVDADCEDCSPDLVIASTTDPEGNLEIASKKSGDPGAGDACLIVYDKQTVGGGNINARQYEAIGAGGAVSPNLFASCGGGGLLTLSGAVALNSEVTFDLAGADPLAFSGRLAFNPADLFAPFGGCTWLVWHPSPGLRVTTTPLLGTDSVTLTLPCDPGLVGGQINAQWMVIGTFDSPWLIPNISLSNIIDFTLGL